MTKLNDYLQRQQATDPCRSFIVQAPAGSGKTEILTQRYLKLLGRVNAPEQIIALTFTRKAASEMRARILRALQQAEHQVEAASSHQQQTLELATDALKRDKMLHWQLTQQPGRLRIITIDSLCQTLTQAIPLQEKQVPYAQITDKPQRHYLAAARACLHFATKNDAYHQYLKTILHHLDNRQDNLLSLFSELLARRDQWLHPLFQAKEQNKATFEQALSLILQHELSRFQTSIPKDCATKLFILAKRLVAIENDPTSPRFSLLNWQSFHQLDGHLATSLASILLTSQNTLRKAFDHHVGLRRGACLNLEYDEIKAASKDLLCELNELPDFLDALLRVKNLPAPQYDMTQWNVLQALFSLLPLLAAHLQLVFTEHNEVDFTTISQQALAALGEDLNPTDLALYLDNSIEHLLVDEFQDTSIQQFQLLNKLVQHWQPNDGKTLFVVGDPMQSIYRFRAAEVGLFLRAKEQGIGPVKLISLELNSNFRSTATIVDWVNQQFEFIFPRTDDIECGAVSYHPSSNVKPASSDSLVMAFQYQDRIQEARALVDLIAKELQTNTTDELAILVRSRNQLTEIIRKLREHNIPFQGVDIDLLAQLPHLQDVWTLTQALLMPANRLAWLALLRSPWCGLSLADLHSIANFAKNKSIYYALSQVEHLTGLSKDGLARVRFIYSVLDMALACRHQQSLISWLTATLNALHLDKVLQPKEQDDLEQFWQLLERFEQDGQIEELELFKLEFNKLYSQQVIPARLKIMTIHKSKGLEFDCVFLPGLSARSAGVDTPLLRWLKLPSVQHEEVFLLSPMKAAHQDNCLLYEYLGNLDAQKNSYESQRLLYVAVTRAKKRLYLFDHSEKINQGTFRHLLKNQEFLLELPDNNSVKKTNNLPKLYHLPIELYQQAQLPTLQNSAPLIITNHMPRLIGIVAHELLQWICDHHISTIAEIPWSLAFHQFKTMGLTDNEVNVAKELLLKQLTLFFSDPIGRWLIRPHENEQNEYELLVQDHLSISMKIIDRTFCENGLRWIIDFKTGSDDNKMQAKHRQQINDYARLFTNQETDLAIRCGLYYLASNHWVAWEFVATVEENQ